MKPKIYLIDLLIFQITLSMPLAGHIKLSHSKRLYCFKIILQSIKKKNLAL